jgi:hypothetical protein
MNFSLSNGRFRRARRGNEMRFFKQTTLLMITVASAFACAATTDSGIPEEMDGTVPETATGGSTAVGTGGTAPVATGGMDTGVPATGGTTPAGTGGAPVSTGTPCPNSTTVQSGTTPNFANGWGAWQGTIETVCADEWCGGESTIAFKSTGADGAISLALGAWSEAGRGCLDVSSLQGIKFNVTGTGMYAFGVKVSGTAEDGHCATADCNAHPRKVFADDTTMGVVQIPFSELAPPDWAGLTAGANFNAAQVMGFSWYVTNGASLTISNIEFY